MLATIQVLRTLALLFLVNNVNAGYNNLQILSSGAGCGTGTEIKYFMTKPTSGLLPPCGVLRTDIDKVPDPRELGLSKCISTFKSNHTEK